MLKDLSSVDVVQGSVVNICSIMLIFGLKFRLVGVYYMTMFFLTDNYWKWFAPLDTNPGCAPACDHGTRESTETSLTTISNLEPLFNRSPIQWLVSSRWWSLDFGFLHKFYAHKQRQLKFFSQPKFIYSDLLPSNKIQ